MSEPPRIAVVSPFLDKWHGTERVLTEQIERLSRMFNWDVHIYSKRVEDLEGSFTLHRISAIGGPYLLQFIWWLCANQFRRWRDQRFGKLRFDLVYSAGINCFDADAIAVHIVFNAYHKCVREQLELRRNPVREWPRILHRRLYYRLIMAIEKRIYRDPRICLSAVSKFAAREFVEFFGRTDIKVIPNAVDAEVFNSTARERLRSQARELLGLTPDKFVLLLVGNDWRKKGLHCVLEALAHADTPQLRLLIVGDDLPSAFGPLLDQLGLNDRVQFLPLRSDVLFYYAAVDIYVGPSIEDAFSMPPLEAMACGLPVIVSRAAGVSELISHGEDGFILENPRDAAALAQQVLRLYQDADLRRRIGENAARTAQNYSWERNTAATKEFLEEAIRLKQERRAATQK
jgi:glycosyltransferase involved in cell wall biosynthesis